MLSPESDISGSDRAVDVNKMFLKEMTALASERRVDRWTVPPGLVSVRTFLKHMMHSLGNVYKDAAWFKR